MNKAHQIADAVLVSVEGEDLLIEAMARAMCKLYEPDIDPDYTKDARGPFWKLYQKKARDRLVCDRVLRGPGDRMAYERIAKIARNAEI